MLALRSRVKEAMDACAEYALFKTIAIIRTPLCHDKITRDKATFITTTFHSASSTPLYSFSCILSSVLSTPLCHLHFILVLSSPLSCHLRISQPPTHGLCCARPDVKVSPAPGTGTDSPTITTQTQPLLRLHLMKKTIVASPVRESPILLLTCVTMQTRSRLRPGQAYKQASLIPPQRLFQHSPD